MSKQTKLLSLQRRYFQDNDAKTTSIMTLSAMAGMAIMYITNNDNMNKTQSESQQQHKQQPQQQHAFPSSSKKSSPNHVGIIETDFMDKIASKSYLNYHNTFTHDSILTSTTKTAKRVWNKIARNNRTPDYMTDSALDQDNVMKVVRGSTQELSSRPKGVPRRIRVLAIDVPEFRDVFDGECRVNLARIYPDDIAPSKYVTRKVVRQEPLQEDHSGSNNDVVEIDKEDAKDDNDAKNNNNNNNNNNNGNQNDLKHKTKTKKNKNAEKKKQTHDKIEIIQKSLARSLVRCRNVHSKRIGVELLEASVYDLNPHNMRRTYQFGSYSYDPGKYGSMNKIPGNDMLQRRITAYGGIPKGNPRDMSSDQNENTTTNLDDNSNNNNEHIKSKDHIVIATDDDEVDAPWNQYAWIEEMELRIHGRIPFGANVERTSWLTRKIFGRNYRITVKKESISPFLWFVPSFFISSKKGGYEGIDGDYGKNRRTINRASSKPHAVIADGSAMQRVPGSLRYLSKCCQEADVPLFIINDPRVWGGNTHVDLESAAKDMRKTVKARIVANALTIKEGSMFERGRMLGKLESETKWQLKDASRRTREAVQAAAARLQKERDENWSELDSKELLKRLLERKVLRIEGGQLKDAGTEEAFGELCRQYLRSDLNNHEGGERSINNSDTSNSSDMSDSESVQHSTNTAVS